MFGMHFRGQSQARQAQAIYNDTLTNALSTCRSRTSGAYEGQRRLDSMMPLTSLQFRLVSTQQNSRRHGEGMSGILAAVAVTQVAEAENAKEKYKISELHMDL